MSFTFKRSATFNGLVLAGLLATVGAGAMAQNAPTAPANAPAAAGKPGQPGERMGRHDPAKMQAMMAKHMADLKAKLKITPAQEGAWTTFTAAMQPPAGQGPWGQRPTAEQRAELDKLSTPERIDKMRTLRAERMAARNTAMTKREDAVKAFYATLTPEQKKTFDAEHRKMGQHGDRGHHGEMHKG